MILISQRGTGLSIPRLACRVEDAVPADMFASADRMTEILGPRAVACAAEWRGKGVDLSAYNTESSADDLEDLRRALGVPKIRLFGFSYGTHLGLAAIRRHPSSIERAVLAGTEGPDHVSLVPTLFISSSLDANTPPYQAEEVRWGFPTGVHLVVENAGHESTLVPEAQRAIVDFLGG